MRIEDARRTDVDINELGRRVAAAINSGIGVKQDDVLALADEIRPRLSRAARDFAIEIAIGALIGLETASEATS